jgi:hypothetical protein
MIPSFMDKEQDDETINTRLALADLEDIFSCPFNDQV